MQILQGDKNPTSLCSKSVSTLMRMKRLSCSQEILHKCFRVQTILNNKWINKNNTQEDRKRTCDSYLPNSLRPIAYLGFKCFRPETRQYGYCSLTENTQNAPAFFGIICLPKPKSLEFGKKFYSGVRPCASSWTYVYQVFLELKFLVQTVSCFHQKICKLGHSKSQKLS